MHFLKWDPTVNHDVLQADSISFGAGTDDFIVNQ